VDSEILYGEMCRGFLLQCTKFTNQQVYLQIPTLFMINYCNQNKGHRGRSLKVCGRGGKLYATKNDMLFLSKRRTKVCSSTGLNTYFTK